MLKLVSAGVVLLWGLCIFLNSFPAGQSLGGGYTRRASPAPRGLEWRKVRRLGGKVVAVRLQVILA